MSMSKPMKVKLLLISLLISMLLFSLTSMTRRNLLSSTSSVEIEISLLASFMEAFLDFMDSLLLILVLNSLFSMQQEKKLSKQLFLLSLMTIQDKLQLMKIRDMALLMEIMLNSRKLKA